MKSLNAICLTLAGKLCMCMRSSLAVLEPSASLCTPLSLTVACLHLRHDSVCSTALLRIVWSAQRALCSCVACTSRPQVSNPQSAVGRPDRHHRAQTPTRPRSRGPHLQLNPRLRQPLPLCHRTTQHHPPSPQNLTALLTRCCTPNDCHDPSEGTDHPDPLKRPQAHTIGVIAGSIGYFATSHTPEDYSAHSTRRRPLGLSTAPGSTQQTAQVCRSRAAIAGFSSTRKHTAYQ